MEQVEEQDRDSELHHCSVWDDMEKSNFIYFSKC
jgi:hypothetical protein